MLRRQSLEEAWALKVPSVFVSSCCYSTALYVADEDVVQESGDKTHSKE